MSGNIQGDTREARSIIVLIPSALTTRHAKHRTNNVEQVKNGTFSSHKLNIQNSQRREVRLKGSYQGGLGTWMKCKEIFEKTTHQSRAYGEHAPISESRETNFDDEAN